MMADTQKHYSQNQTYHPKQVEGTPDFVMAAFNQIIIRLMLALMLAL